MFAEHCASLFQPQYVDGLLNPSHRTLSFTTELATPLGRALSVWGFSLDFFQLFALFQVLFFHLGTPFQSDYTLPLPFLGSFWPFWGFFYLFASCCSRQSRIQSCIRGLLHWTIASHSRPALIDSREYSWKWGFLKLKFAWSLLWVILVSEWILFINAVWPVWVPLLITVCAFSEALWAFLLGLFTVCMLKYFGRFGL